MPGSIEPGSIPEIRLYPIPAAGLFLFLAGVALGIPVNVVGNLLAGELLLALIALAGIVANIGNPDFLDRRLVCFIGLFLLSLCVYVTTDFLWQTELHDAARGWARFIFLIADFLGMWVIGRRYRFNIFALFIGYMAGQLLAWARPQPTFHWYVTLWKHHLCLPVLVGTLCAAGLFLKRGKAAWSVAILMGFGLVSFQADTRAFGLICFVTAAVVAARALVFERIRALLPFLLMATLVLSAVAANTLLDETHDRFGQRQMTSNEERYAAMMTALQTITDHPWVGIGSWKTDFAAANRHRANLVEAGGRQDSEAWSQSGHSQVLQTWLEGGPLAALAFLYFLWRMVIAVRWTLTRPVDGFLAFAVFALLNGIWSCLFSPFLGADVRVNAAIAIYVCVVLAREKTNLARAQA